MLPLKTLPTVPWKHAQLYRVRASPRNAANSALEVCSAVKGTSAGGHSQEDPRSLTVLHAGLSIVLKLPSNSFIPTSLVRISKVLHIYLP